MTTAEVDTAFVFLDDALADPETQPGAFGGFCREEWLKQAPGVFLADAASGIDDGDGDASPSRLGFCHIGDAEAERAAVRHGLDGVADEIEKDLAQFAGKATRETGGGVFPLQGDAVDGDRALLEFDDIVEQIGHRDGDGLLGVAVKTQGLAGDMRGSLEFLLGQGGVVLRFGVERGVIAQKIKRVGDGFERIVDFVRNDAGNAPHGGELFRLAQSVFRLDLRRNVALNFENRVSFAVEHLAGGNHELTSVAGAHGEVAMPRLGGLEDRLRFFTRDGEHRMQELMKVASGNLFALPAIEGFGAGIPKTNAATHIADDDGLGGQLQQLGAFAVMGFALAQLFGAVFDAPLQLAVEAFELASLAGHFDKEPDLGAQHFGNDRNGDVVDGAAAVAVDLVDIGEVNAGDEDEGGLAEPRVLAEHVGQLESIELRHADIHQNHRNIGFEENTESFPGRGGLDQVLTKLPEDDLVT